MKSALPISMLWSRDPAVRAQAENLFEGEPVDFLFIDGDHRVEGAQADFPEQVGYGIGIVRKAR